VVSVGVRFGLFSTDKTGQFAHLMCICKIRALLLAAALPGVAFTGCKRGGADAGAEFNRLTTELQTTHQKLAETEKTVNAQKQEIDRMTLEAQTAKKEGSDKNVLLIQKDTQIQALQTQLNESRDALVFANASANHQKGFSSIALDRYRQFVVDYPKSPLVADANRAIAELTRTVENDARARANFIDPKRRDREALQHFQDGIATVDEISPLVRQKSAAEVVKLLGPPNRTYRNGTEIGYVDRIIDPTTGSKETLVIVFQDERAVSIRVGYRGREIKL
jgi:septal ring factor EnvC (AmiA/AmiB activator)